jgi:hypothetical protein
MTTTKAPTEDSTLPEWKDWIRDHTDMHFGTVQLDARVVLALVAARDSFRDQVERVMKSWDEERQRL